MKGVLLVMLFVAGIATGESLARQERPPNYPVTRQWTAAALKRSDTDLATWQLRVIDTAGVCVYVLLGSPDPVLSTVPKTALPPGTGCQ